MMLGEVIRGWRRDEFKNIRSAAKAIGISTATLSRLENGKSVNGHVMVTVMLWLFQSPNKGLANDQVP